MYCPSGGQGVLQNATRTIRAAVYTRVSTDESLGMEFNSLDAQLEACAAYITSQRHEGWVPVDKRYDDGGYSGGSMKRPALERLLADVKGGLIDVIVVYKIDRLTRSLADFSRIVDVLDAHGSSFISITQAFSTTTSMGRLTLNVLLSFAQFEREVGAERVRDKIDSSKKKGMWMGGVVPLGYDVLNRKLIVNDTEAENVRLIFERYIALRSVTLLEPDLQQQGIVSKLTVGKSGVARGGDTFGRGALYNLLQNVTYIGQVAHRGQAYPGQHEAIIEQSVFEKAQAILTENRRKQKNGQGAQECSLLAGLLFDERGKPLIPSHTSRGAPRFRYYVAKTPDEGRKRRFRVPAGEMERVVISSVSEWLLDRHAVEAAYASGIPDAVAIKAVLMTAARCAQDLVQQKPARVRELLLAIVRRLAIGQGMLTIELKGGALLTLADLGPAGPSQGPVRLEVECQLVRRSKEVRLAVAPKSSPRDPDIDPSLVKLLVKAHAARNALFASNGLSLAEVSQAEGHDPHYFSVLVKLSYLAPDITQAILEGRQPPRLNRQVLARIRNLPMEWSEQRNVIESAGRL
jgi:site-specific DNA recombinase